MEEEIIYFYNVKDGKYYQSRYTHRWLNNLQQQVKKQKEVIDKLKDKCNKLKEYFNERIEVCDNRLSSPFCNFEKATKERLILTQCLEKLEELEQGSDSNE